MTTTRTPDLFPTETGLPKLDARELRAYVDAAASMRKNGGDPVYGVVDMGEFGLRLNVIQWPGDQPPPNAVFEINTPEVWEGRTPPTDVTLTHDSITSENLAETYDAVFWSEAAVEKFVLPYYASKSLWDAASTLTDLSMAWYGKVPDTAVAANTNSYRTNSDDVIPFALGHTPDSDYRTLDDFEVLFKEQGEIKHMKVTEFVRHHRGAAAG